MYVLYVKKKQCSFPYSYIAKLYCFEELGSPNYLFGSLPSMLEALGSIHSNEKSKSGVYACNLSRKFEAILGLHSGFEFSLGYRRLFQIKTK